MTRRPLLLIMIAALVAASVANAPLGSRLASAEAPRLPNLALSLALVAAAPPELVLDPTWDPPMSFNNVKPREFDPAQTNLVQTAWLRGLGCPTNGFTSPDGSTRTPLTDPACTTGDPKDMHNEGLLLVKTGPTNNFAEAFVELTNLKGLALTELGYDIRKQGGSSEANPAGSHCGAGAPRFTVITTDGLWFVGCRSPMANSETLGNGWTRLRWGVLGVVTGFKDGVLLSPITGTIRRMFIEFDEGQDVALDFFGAAILDNIDVNEQLVGRGPTQPN